MPTSTALASATATSVAPTVAIPLSSTSLASANSSTRLMVSSLIEGEATFTLSASMSLALGIPPVEPPASIAARTLKTRSVTLS